MRIYFEVQHEVDTANPDEEDVLKTLKEHASEGLEADLLGSAYEVGLSQVCCSYA